MILKDTEPMDIIARHLDSVAPYVDGIYYTITHSTKKPSKEAVELQKAIAVYCLTKNYPEPVFSNFKWVKDFSAARNFNWSQVPEDFEWVFWMDADDIVRGAERFQESIEKANKINAEAIFANYLYQVELDANGQIRNVLIEHLRERLIRNNGAYKWVGAIHETLIEQRGTNKVDMQDFDVVHLTDGERMGKAIYRNIEILEEELKKQGKQQDPRIVYYLGKAYFDLRTEENFQKAELLINKYLNGSETNVASGWEEERSQAWQYLSEIARIRGQINKAIKSTMNSIIENPKFPQYYIDQALNYVYQKRWDKALFWVQLSQHVPYPRTTLVLNPRDMQARVYEILFNIAIGNNNIEQAYAATEKLYEIFPDDSMIKERLTGLKEVKEDNETAFRIVQLVKHLEARGERDKIEWLLKAVPSKIAEEPIISSIRKDFLPSKVWKDNEIAIVCGPGFEKWGPESLKKGIGGSEEAVIHVSRELAKLGWHVTVYADPEKTEFYEYETGSVTYKLHYEFNPYDNFNILIGWRNPGFFEHTWNAKKTYLWLHDVQNPMEYTEKRVKNITKIFVLSEAHKRTLLNEENKKFLTDDKFLLTGNGINVEEFEELDKKKIGRDHARVIWTSSYDRGLEILLDMWPDVVAEVPNAELHIFYGWNLFDTIFHNNPERQAWKAKVNSKMNHKGIVHHGRVGQDVILEETFKSGVWAYPTYFYEISCITAMKAQAGGAIPVVTDYAALSETVQHGCKIDVKEADIYEKPTKQAFKKQLIKTLQLSNESQNDIREPMMKWARNKFKWSAVANQWSGEFNGK